MNLWRVFHFLLTADGSSIPGWIMGFKQIGNKIQLAREARGMTQSDLAIKLEITQAALSNYELGKRRLYLNQIQKIAEILGQDLSYFIDDETFYIQPPPRYLSDITWSGKNEISLKEDIIQYIKSMSNDDIQTLHEILEYLEWKKNRTE